MKTILATIVSMFLFVSFANAQAKSCADLIKGYDAAVKTEMQQQLKKLVI
ncbi:MAG: hypothetical protein RIT01_574 [Pseudomonadota bacterium]